MLSSNKAYNWFIGNSHWMGLYKSACLLALQYVSQLLSYSWDVLVYFLAYSVNRQIKPELLHPFHGEIWGEWSQYFINQSACHVTVAASVTLSDSNRNSQTAGSSNTCRFKTGRKNYFFSIAFHTKCTYGFNYSRWCNFLSCLRWLFGPLGLTIFFKRSPVKLCDWSTDPA
jgi:hypothetical protein